MAFFVSSAAPGLDLHFGGDSTLLPSSCKMVEEGYYRHHNVAISGAADETTKNAILFYVALSTLLLQRYTYIHRCST